MIEMHPTAQKEAFSKAYVAAVAAVAGFGFRLAAEPDHDSIDVEFASRGTQGTFKKPRLEAQLKCTAREPATDELHFPLSRKNYDDLRVASCVPRILIVVLVPLDPSSWMTHTEEEMILRHCGYWLSLRGLGDTPNTATITVKIPRSQTFNPASLQSLMARVAERNEA